MKTVIYHSADYDGIFCREIAKHFLGTQDVQYIGWNFGDPKIPFPDDGDVYVMDLPPECLTHTPQRAASSLIWIDHHKTSIEKWPDQIRGYRIDGVAACRLAWQWFTMVDGNTPRSLRAGGSEPISPAGVLPMVQHFKNREVTEPLAVRLAGEYDVWDKRDERAELLQYGLRSTESIEFAKLLNEEHNGKKCTAYTFSVIEKGESSRVYSRTVDAGNMKASFLTEWEGLRFLCLNGRGNSLTFASKDAPATGHDALLLFYTNGTQWIVSLYHAQDRKELDLSEIAKKYGGGGHRGACGFQCDKLPFLP